jgi:hypothetical protein
MKVIGVVRESTDKRASNGKCLDAQRQNSKDTLGFTT